MIQNAPSMLGVVPILIGPIQVLLMILPGLLIALGSLIITMLKPQSMWNGLKLLWRQKLVVVILIAVGAGVFYAGRWAMAAMLPKAQRLEAGAADWPMFRGSMLRLGSLTAEPGPNRGGLVWQHKQSGEAFFSSPTVVGNRVYVAGSRLGLGSAGGSGLIYCFDADTGAVAWSAAPPGYRPTFSSPAVVGDRLVCGEGLHYTTDSRVVCLDTRDGKTLWTFRTNNHVECTPVISDGRVFFGAGSDGYYGLSLEGDGSGNAKVLWHVPGGKKYPDSETSLIAYEGKVYAGLGNDGHAIAVLDAATGQELSRIEMPYPVFSPPAIADGKLYVGMGNGDFVKGAAELGVPAAGQVVCIDLKKLTVDWTYKTSETVLSAVAASGNELVFADRAGDVYLLDTAGKLLARWSGHTGMKTSPAVSSRRVYVVNDSGILYALDRRTLEPVWELRIGSSEPVGGVAPLFVSSPAIARGHAYVGSQYEGLVCAGESADEKEVFQWPGALGTSGVLRGHTLTPGDPFGTPLPALGEFQWQFPPDQSGQSDIESVLAPIAVAGKQLLLPIAVPTKLPDGSTITGLVALPVEGTAATAAKPAWTHSTPLGVFLSPAVYENSVLLVTGRPSDKDRKLECLDLATGNVAWSAPVGDGSGLFTTTRTSVLIQDLSSTLTCYSLAGAKQWSSSPGTLAAAPTVVNGIVLLPLASPAAVVALDLATGKTLWNVPMQAAPTTPAAVASDHFFIGTTAGVERRSLCNGQPAKDWHCDGGPTTTALSIAGNALIYVNNAGELVFADRASGSVTARTAGARPGVPPLIARDQVLFQTPQGISSLALDAPDGKPKTWADTSWLGAPTAPMVVAGSHLYFGSRGWGLVRVGGTQ